MVKVITKKRGKSLKQQLDEMLQPLSGRLPKRKWEKFFGKVKFSGDAVSYQRKLRDE
jgi:hypothetical protein